MILSQKYKKNLEKYAKNLSIDNGCWRSNVHLPQRFTYSQIIIYYVIHSNGSRGVDVKTQNGSVQPFPLSMKNNYDTNWILNSLQHKIIHRVFWTKDKYK